MRLPKATVSSQNDWRTDFMEAECNVQVKIDQGILVGTTEETLFEGKIYFAFYGVPFARPPLGKLRFKNPKPPLKWKYPFDGTTEFHGACAQSHIVHKHGLYGVEDCLHLNIYTPELPKHTNTRPMRAVILWIHGYAFTSGFSHIHGPDFLIDNDIIVVTLTHRIGVFGFMKLNETDNHTNMGLKDIIRGLKWIHRNIGAFGGNNDNITIMSSGSAATFVSLLLTTKFRKLFAKVIIQSGSMFAPSLFHNDHQFEKNKLEQYLKQNGFKNISSTPSSDLLTLSSKIYNKNDFMNTQMPLIPFMPIKETNAMNSLLHQDSPEFVKTFKKFSEIPILIGFNSREGITEVVPFIHNPGYLKLLKAFKYIVPFFGGCSYKYGTQEYYDIGEVIKKRYFKDDINEQSFDDFLTYVSDLYKFPIYKFIQTYLNLSDNPMYVYKFNYVGKFNVAKATAIAGANVKIKGAAHGDEICYKELKMYTFWNDLYEKYYKPHICHGTVKEEL
ncbi:unnamed protein product [Leptidea sinapis]|uniref:Carboxylesterase type B domain-containing protein n=1 Tax=Leptidea sinapis TaxID=189913 RepID=A0A5E4PLS8_9NEOP|nr:unnamed protein product [Leptidea sinapis]